MIDIPANVTCKLSMPDAMHLYGHIKSNARHAKRVAHLDSHKGQSVAICGAGPTLADAKIDRGVDWVWACNSALPYMWDRGDLVTHGFGIDQGEAMLGPAEWGRALPVRYLLASSVSPKLVNILKHRHLTFFHSFLGIPEPPNWKPPEPGLAYEMWLYRTRYKPSVQVGHGLNSVPRAICLAIAMGFTRIVVYGADCACAVNSPPMPVLGTPEYEDWMHELVIYADGRTASVFGTDAVMAEAMIDGRRWHTRPDMVISARHMLDLCQKYPGRIELVGDTLPNVLGEQNQNFMDRLPALTGVGQVTGFGNAALATALAEAV